MTRRRLTLALAALLVLLLVACGGQTPPTDPDEDVYIPETTEVLDEGDRAALLEFAPDGTLHFAAAANLPTLEPGDVLVSQPATAAPNGLLRKVVSLRTEGDELIVETEQAKLEEAIYQGDFSFSRTLTPADLESGVPLTEGVLLIDAGPTPQGLNPQAEANFTLGLNDVILYDQDGDTSTKDDQVKANGAISFTPSFDIDLGLDWNPSFTNPFNVDLEFMVLASFGERAELALGGELNAELDEEVELASYDFKPITVYIGPVPVVFTPKLTLLLGADGELSAAMSFAATQDLTLAVGVAYDDGWKDLSELDASFSGMDASFSGSVELKSYAGVKFDIFLYGLVGPYGRLDAYLEMDGEIPRAPTWLLYGGLEAWVGIDSVDVLDLTYDKKVLGAREEIARAGNSAPTVEIGNDGGERQLNHAVSLRARTDDREDGPDCCTVTWYSSRGGNLGEGTGFFHELDYSFDTVGPHIITAEVKDSGGATSSDSVTYTVVNTPPAVELTRPTASEEIYRDVPYVLRGLAYDPNEPGTELACERLEWTSSLLTDPLPQTGCDVSVAFDSNGPRTLTLTGTDPQGESDSVSVDITVVDPPENLPPSVQIISPRNHQVVGPDERLTLAGEASDPEGESELTYDWSVSYESSSGPTTLEIGSGNNLDWAPSDTIPGLECEVSMTVQLSLEVTDPGGSRGTDFILLDIMLIC